MDDFYSLLPALRVPVSDLPKINHIPPEFPYDLNGRPAIIIFLRHCGCPFAEKAFKQLRAVAGAYGNKLNYYAVSHASKADVCPASPCVMMPDTGLDQGLGDSTGR